MGHLKFYSDCVSIPKNKINSLINMVDNSIDISRKTFLKHVDKCDLQFLENNFGYSTHYKQGLTMSSDWHVSYHRGKLENDTCYYFKHSAIEYMFLDIS